MEKNHELEQAWEFIETTGTSVFLTGKAGTGKTTFLRQLREKMLKRMIVVAPTGVAAINAGGVTIHSFFQLSFSPFIPDTTRVSKREVFRFSKEKKDIIRSLDLLVIDEISMVRSDLLDAVDSVLRKYKEATKPFGGVQLLMIGDLQQLPPVLKDDEQQLLSHYYSTPYFFGSHALQQIDYVTVELRKIYRQSDVTFVNLLNRIRENRIDSEVLKQLNARYIPHFRPTQEEGYIRLTTHNASAQRYNEGELRNLPTSSHTYVAQIDGIFPQHAFPADLSLVLKQGAQVMFIKNDISGAHRFYNGKIGHVVSLTDQHVIVRCVGENTDITVEQMVWENTKYTLDAQTKEIREEVEGVFKQFPLRLAWAITIHKSQGLTFERAVIDSSAAFAHGQVYVALSRCKTLEGTVLASPLSESAVITDEEVTQFVDKCVAGTTQNEQLLDMLKQQYYVQQLCELFDFTQLHQRLQHIHRFLEEYFYKTYPQLLVQHRAMLSNFSSKVMQTSTQFATLCKQMSYSELRDLPFQQRITKGTAYFKQQLDEWVIDLLAQTKVESDNKELIKRFTEAMQRTQELAHVKVSVCEVVSQQGFSILAYLREKEHARLRFTEEKRSPSKQRAVKGKLEIPSDILQPELYNQLREWRRKQCEELGRPAYTIMHQTALMAITNYMPETPQQLMDMPHFGKSGTEKYGAEILEIIARYVQKSKVVRPVWVIKEKEKKEKIDTKKATLELYLQGNSPDKIAQIRQLARATIYNHLIYHVSQGKLPVTRFITQERVNKIIEKIGNQEEVYDSLDTLKTKCGNDYDYNEIRLTLAHLQALKSQ